MRAGDAAGFSIESVLMLSGIRAGNKKISLMHYLAALVATKEPHLLDFAVDLKGQSPYMSAAYLDFETACRYFEETGICRRNFAQHSDGICSSSAINNVLFAHTHTHTYI